MASSTTNAATPGTSAAAQSAARTPPASLDEFVRFLTTVEDPALVIQKLNSFESDKKRDALLASTLEGGDDALDVLDAGKDTLGYLFILSARIRDQGAAAPAQQLRHLEIFCSKFNPEHARKAPGQITSIAKGILRAAGDNPKQALSPLRDLLSRYPPDLTYLTNIHPLFLNICVSTRHYSAALPFLSVPILNVDTTLSELHYNDNLLYHYAGGVVFTALKRWREAEEFFEIVVTSPAQVPAAIQLEALKKLTLVQLILYGRAIQPPKYANGTLIRLIKISPYNTLAKHYPQTVTALTSYISKDVDAFRSDQNFGLAQQVIDRAPRWLIKKLTSTYLTLGLDDIGKEVGLPAETVRTVLVNMVECGDINASISVDGTVTFSDSTPHFTKAEVDNALVQAQAQGKLLHDLERALNASKEYLTKALKHKDESWGGEDDVYGTSNSAGAWADESMYA